jgi:hypothetical protein
MVEWLYGLPENVVEPIKIQIGLKRWGTIQELYQTVDFLIETGIYNRSKKTLI